MSLFLFDMDGVLLDSMPLWEHLGEDFLRLHGRVPKPDFRSHILTMSMPQAAALLQEEYGFTQREKELVAGLDQLAAGFYTEKAPAKEGVREALEDLARQGCPCVVATATDHHLAEAALRRTGLLPFFHHIYTCTELRLSKDGPAFVQKILEKEGVAPEGAVVVEDAIHAIRSARAAQIPVLAIFDETSREVWPQIRALAQWSLEDWRDFPQLSLASGK